MNSILRKTTTYRILLVVFLLFLLPGFAQSQSSIFGVVRDAAGGGIPGVTVQVSNSLKGVHADEEGKYTLNGLAAGTYEISYSFIGFRSQTKSLVLENGENLEVDITLSENSQGLDEVRIFNKSDVQEGRESAYNVNVVDTRMYANTTADLSQVLNRMGGIRVQETGGLGSDFRFSINGLSGNHIKFFIDGIPMESYGGGLSLNNIPVNLAEKIEVYKGVVPAYLGSDALGGAVNIITKGRGGNKLDASYSVGSFNTHRAAISGGYTAPKSGITINVNSYYNFSDNNYYMRNNPEANVKLEVIEDGKFVTRDKLRRFHDGFESYMGQVEVGISNKKWVDVLVLGLTHTSTYKERQTGATQEKVIGEMTTQSHNTIPSLRYRKDDLFVKGLGIRAFANLSNDKIVVTDTSSRTWYQWNGIPNRVNQSGGELGEKKSITHLTGGNGLGQLNVNYALGANHMFNLNYNFNSSFRESYNEIDPYNHSYDRSNRLNRNTVGFTYQQEFFDAKLANSFFVKNFNFAGKVVAADSSISVQTSNYWGYGAASRYKLTEQLGIKASFEYALRLPGLVELYGNAEEVMGNPSLRPENSNNYNLGFFFIGRFGDHFLSAEATGFYRDTKDYIYSMPAVNWASGGDFSMFYNAGGIKIDGFELDLRYEYFRLMSFSVNMSYQNAVDRERFARGTNREKITYGSRIPNQPWLYGNADFNIGKSDVLGKKGTRIQFNWFTQYINSYSLSWSKLGNKSTKDYIPMQLIHNAALTYSLKSGRYNITLETRNLTDEIAYDNFKLQKPGRSFSLKFRYVLASYNLFNY